MAVANRLSAAEKKSESTFRGFRGRVRKPEPSVPAGTDETGRRTRTTLRTSMHDRMPGTACGKGAVDGFPNNSEKEGNEQ